MNVLLMSFGHIFSRWFLVFLLPFYKILLYIRVVTQKFHNLSKPFKGLNNILAEIYRIAVFLHEGVFKMHYFFLTKKCMIMVVVR